MKKMMLLALASVSAMLVLPTFASANQLHLNATGALNISGGVSELKRTSGSGIVSKKLLGGGFFETTTTGTVEITFSEVSSELGACTTFRTTKLPFHLVTLSNGSPGILITTLNGHFASTTCGGFVPVSVNGNGVLGTITSPACGGTSFNFTFSFAHGVAGHQQQNLYTGVNYGLTSTIIGSTSPTSLGTAGTIHTTQRTLTCT